jgi:hypothetical protein
LRPRSPGRGEIVLVTPKSRIPRSQKTSAAITGNMMRFIGDTLVPRPRGAYVAGWPGRDVSRDG